MTARQVFEKRVPQIIAKRHEQTPDEIGWAAVFLASYEARCITGQSLIVVGGAVIE
jgi:enoyl-[acyl-carrier-protein] reductase (NADH)